MIHVENTDHAIGIAANDDSTPAAIFLATDSIEHGAAASLEHSLAARQNPSPAENLACTVAKSHQNQHGLMLTRTLVLRPQKAIA